MSNTLVRLKKQPSTNIDEQQVLIKVQYKQKQYPLPVPSVKVRAKHFEQDHYDHWLNKTYVNKEGIKRSKSVINNRIKKYKTRIDTALEILEELDFEKLDVAIIRNALDKSAKEIKANRIFMIDSFFEDDFMKVFHQEFMTDPFVADDIKNIKALEFHLKSYSKTLDIDKPLKMKNFNSKLLSDFTQYLLGYQFKKGPLDDPYTYLTHDTVYKQIKKLRRFMTFCRDVKRKDFPGLDYKFPYKGTLDVMNPLSLYPLELDTIYYKNDLTPQMMTAKKLFFLAFAVGGQRISDIEHIVKNKLYKKDFRQYWQKKTKKQMFSGLLDAYFKKYQEDDIPLYTGKHINTLLKNILTYFKNKVESNADFRKYCTDSRYEDAFIRTITKKSYRGRTGTANWSKPIPLALAYSYPC